MFTVYFSEEQPKDYQSAQQCNVQNYARFFCGMLDAGVYLPPSQFEAAHISIAHSDADIDSTLRAARFTFSNWGKWN
jgi:glutamate-1-semialdehyde 2,1-aminomutase